MNKGTRWYFIVLILVTILWVVSSTSTPRRRKRQLLRRNAFYLQQLHNGHYLYPIPVTFPPYFRRRAPLTHAYPNGVTIETPWIPLPNGEMKKNVYIPPLRPPALIVTRKPIKNTFDIPLTKTIQVSQGKPKVRSMGYVRKNVVKIHATRTTTESPSVKALGALAESTVQTLLNFTPAHEDWRPNSLTTSHPAVAPNPHFGRNSGSKVDKQLNYTGVRYGKVNTLMESMPQNGAGIKVLKNESNFVMRFTPEDVRYTAVNLNTENLETPFLVDSPELKHLKDEFKEHRTYIDGFSSTPQKKEEDLRKEVNIPYQRYKTVDRPLTVNNHGINPGARESSKDRKSVFDIFPSVQKTNQDQKLKDTTPFQGQGSFLTEPFSSERINPASGIKDNPNKQDGTYATVPFGSQKIRSEVITGKPSIRQFNNQFTRPANANRINKDQQNKSVPPHQDFVRENNPSVSPNVRQQSAVKGNPQQRPLPTRPQQTLYFDSGKLVTGAHRNKDVKHSIPQIPGYDSATKVNPHQHSSANNPQQVQFFDNVSRKPVTETSNNKDTKQSNGNIWSNPTRIGPKNTPSNNGIPTIDGNSKDFGVNSFPHGGNYNFNLLSNSFKNNRSHDQSAITISEFPLITGVEKEKNSSRQPNAVDLKGFKSSQENHNTGAKFQEFDSHKHNINSHIASISHEDVSSVNNNQNKGFGNGGKVSSKPVFEQEHKLKEIELKNPPKYLQFGHEDFIKPSTHASFENANDDAKKFSTFPFSARDKSQELLHKENTDTSSEVKTKTPKLQNSLSSHLPASKVEYADAAQSTTSMSSTEEIDDIYFQPAFPGVAQEKTLDDSQQKFQNYNSGETLLQSSGGSKDDNSKSPVSNKSQKANIKPPNSRDKFKNTVDVSNDVIIITNPSFSPEDTKRTVGRAVSVAGGSVNGIPQIITPPPVITLKYDSPDADNVLNKKGNLLKRLNRTDNYVIQRKPALVPEGNGKSRKPKITISTGMLAGILIAALVFLGFLTGSMVYAFHQWKFSSARGDRQKKKKARNPGFPPEYLDESFAGNTYIHNNIFLPTPQNMDERNPSDPDNTSMAGGEEVAQDQLQHFRSSSRTKRYRFREPGDD